MKTFLGFMAFLSVLFYIAAGVPLPISGQPVNKVTSETEFTLPKYGRDNVKLKDAICPGVDKDSIHFCRKVKK